MLNIAKTTELLIQQLELTKGDVLIFQVDGSLSEGDKADLNRAMTNAMSRTGKIVSTAVIEVKVDVMKIPRTEATANSYIFYVTGDFDYASQVEAKLKQILKHVVVIPRFG
ncbi:MAG: hypothetical protein DRJ03_18600 [Chloroflexi bacterium]|nr:MAG: hypothetical protein DRJ03_18600 [Chloroflexota bacterium]